MCGLVGLVNKYQNGFTQEQKDVFATLLFLDMLRGDDSTGAFVIQNNGDMSMAKDAVNSPTFIKTKEFDDLMSKAYRQGSAMIGHNRKATRGTISDANAHPFIVDDRICLVHNGTLWGDHKQHADVDVDSHAIAHLLSKHTPDEVVNKIQGAYALIWYDFEKGELNFLRNKERPLYWVETDNAWLWCSELCMLEFVRARFNLKFKGNPCLLPEHTINTFKLENKDWEVSNRKLDYKPPVYSGQQNQYNYPNYRDACAWSGAGFNMNCLGDSDYYGMNDGTEYPYQRSSSRASHSRWVNSPSNNGGVVSIPQVSGTGDCSVTDNEMKLGREAGTLMTVNEFNKLHQDYPYGGEVKLQAFDASCVNEVDDRDGVFLWLKAVDDPDVIFRYKYRLNTITEERAIELVTSASIFTAKVNTKAWHKVDDIKSKGESVGWVLINVDGLTMVQKGVTNETIQ